MGQSADVSARVPVPRTARSWFLSPPSSFPLRGSKRTGLARKWERKRRRAGGELPLSSCVIQAALARATAMGGRKKPPPPAKGVAVWGAGKRKPH